MFRPFLSSSAALAALLLCACADRPVPLLPEDDGNGSLASRFGMASQFPWGLGEEARAARSAMLERMVSLDVTYDRIDFTWHKLERAPGEWTFDDLDAVVEDATAAGVRLLGVLAYSNPIYDTLDGEAPGTDLPLDSPPEVHFPPKDVRHYADYVAAVVGRYGDVVKDWELWNEPNIGYRFYRPDANPAHYAALARAGALAGRAVCPDCRFVLGGLSVAQPIPKLDIYPPAAFFLRELYAVDPDLSSWVDAIAVHPYQYPKDPPEHETAAFPSQPQGSLSTQLADMRMVMRRDGGGESPLWITENGWPTNPGIPETVEELSRVFGIDPDVVRMGKAALGEEDFRTVLETIRGVSEEDQARYLVRATLISMAEGAPRILHYALDDYPIEPEINQESAFGVFRTDGSEKPAANAIRVMLQRYGRFSFAGDVATELGLQEPARALALRDGDDVVYALWRWRDGTQTVALSGLPGTALARSMQGEVVARADLLGRLAIEVGPDVVWIEAPAP